jgi:putative hydrolase of the HAD superfamily
MKPQAVTFDIGGIIYSDDVFKRAIFAALESLAGTIDSARFEEIYLEHLKSQSGSLRSKLSLAFLGTLDAKEELMARANSHWKFSASDLYSDAKGCIEEVRSLGCSIGIVANQAATVVESLQLHGIAPLIDYMGVSALVGVEKPNPEIFSQALSALGCKASEVIHIGNRLDTDVLPAKNLGMRTAWILRGEANPNPSSADLSTPDIVLKSLHGVPEAIATLQ